MVVFYKMFKKDICFLCNIFKNCMSSEEKDTLLHQLEDKIKTP